MFDDLKQAFSKNKTIAGTIAAVFGFIADVCQPLAPFAKYLFFISLAVLITLGVVYLLKIARARILQPLVFVVMATFVLGVMYGLQSSQESDRGFLASQIPALEKMQENFGIIKQDLDEIKSATKDIKQDTADIKQDTSEIKGKIDDIADVAFKQGGIISNPQTAEEFYHNAWLFEKNGDYGNARKAYVKYFSFNTNKLDPHINFQKFLKIQEGLAGAKEIYNEMFDDSNLINKYAKILLENKEQKLAKLQAFADENPNFAPVFYELAKAYSPSANAEQSIDDKKNEKEYINKFLSLNDEGKLARYFIDKTMLNEWLQYINERKIQLDKISDKINNFVYIKHRCVINSNGCFVTFSISEKIKEFEFAYRTNEDKGFRGDIWHFEKGEDFVDITVRVTYSNSVEDIEKVKKFEYIEVKYIDMNDKIQGPFRLDWNIKLENGKIVRGESMAAILYMKSIMEGENAIINSDVFAKLRTGSSELGVCDIAFSFHSDAVEKIAYSINNDKLDKIFNPSLNANSNKIKIKPYVANSKFYHQFIFKDDTKSRIFENTLTEACDGKI